MLPMLPFQRTCRQSRLGLLALPQHFNVAQFKRFFSYIFLIMALFMSHSALARISYPLINPDEPINPATLVDIDINENNEGVLKFDLGYLLPYFSYLDVAIDVSNDDTLLSEEPPTVNHIRIHRADLIKKSNPGLSEYYFEVPFTKRGDGVFYLHLAVTAFDKDHNVINKEKYETISSLFLFENYGSPTLVYNLFEKTPEQKEDSLSTIFQMYIVFKQGKTHPKLHKEIANMQDQYYELESKQLELKRSNSEIPNSLSPQALELMQSQLLKLRRKSAVISREYRKDLEKKYDEKMQHSSPSSARALKKSALLNQTFNAGDTITFKFHAKLNNSGSITTPLEEGQIEIFPNNKPGTVDLIKNGEYTYEVEFDNTSITEVNVYAQTVGIRLNFFGKEDKLYYSNADVDATITPCGNGCYIFEETLEHRDWSAFAAAIELNKLATSVLGLTKSDYVLRQGGNDLSFYSPVDGSITIGVSDMYSWDTVAHEFATAIDNEYNVSKNIVGEIHNGSNQYDFQFGDPREPNRILNTYKDKAKSTQLAFSEGFSTWFGVNLLEYSQLSVPNIGDGLYSFPNPFDLEQNNDRPYRGEDTELAIQNLLWDLSDSNVDSHVFAQCNHSCSDNFAKAFPSLFAQIFNGK